MTKFKKSILLGGLIILILIISLFSWKLFINKINSTYYATTFESTDKEAEYCIIDNQTDFAILLRNIVPEKYTNDYFLKNFVVVFKTIETKENHKSVISSYKIKDNILTIKVKSKNTFKETTKSGWVVLELSKDVECSFDSVKIIKNNKHLDSVDVKQNEVIDVKKFIENEGEGMIKTYLCKIDNLHVVIYWSFTFMIDFVPGFYFVGDYIFEDVPQTVYVVNEDVYTSLPNSYKNDFIDDDDLKLIYDNFRKYYKKGEKYGFD